MANTVVRTFDLYNTTFYWNGYTVPGFSTQITVASAFYVAQYSSNPVGSQIDFFTSLTTGTDINPAFKLYGITFSDLPYLWNRYWYDQAVYYSNPAVLSAVQVSLPSYYGSITESIGSLYYINQNIAPFNSITNPLLLPEVSTAIQNFYQVALNLFETNIAAIGPNGTDTFTNNSNLIPATTDLQRRYNSTATLTQVVNSMYPVLSSFLSYNTQVIGNLITPYYWSITMPYESPVGSVNVDQTNSTTGNQVQLTTISLSA